jgi:hypothetical protein
MKQRLIRGMIFSFVLIRNKPTKENICKEEKQKI